jgi:hypothetical protein
MPVDEASTDTGTRARRAPAASAVTLPAAGSAAKQ